MKYYLLALALAATVGAAAYSVAQIDSPAVDNGQTITDEKTSQVISFRLAKREGHVYVDVLTNSLPSSTNFFIPEEMEMNVYTVVIENGTFTDGLHSRVGFALITEEAGSTSDSYTYFLSDAFETQTHNFTTPIKIREGDRIFLSPIGGEEIDSFVQISLRGTEPTSDGIRIK